MNDDKSRPYIYLFCAHSLLYILLTVLAYVFFQFDIPNTLWATYANDSWKFITNMLQPFSPPYPYHLMATSMHFYIPFSVLSVFLPPELALFLAVLLIQNLFSLFTLFLFYRLFLEDFNLSPAVALFLAFFYELVFLGPFLLLATAEVLFIFYQSLTWMLFVKKKYFLSALTAAMAFALRFNGSFFIVGMIIIYFSKWNEEREISVVKSFQVSIVLFLMFLIGFSSFIWSFLFQGDFWLPLTSELSAYQRWEGYASIGVITLPFLWWLNYLNWSFLSNSILEISLLSLAVFFLALGLISLIQLYKRSSIEKDNKIYRDLFILFSCGFIGANIVVSGRNFTRFLISVFPVIPILPVWLKNRSFSTQILSIILVIGFLVFIVVNLFFWFAVEPLTNCLPYFG